MPPANEKRIGGIVPGKDVPCRREMMDLSNVPVKRARTPHYDDPAAVGLRIRGAREAAGLSQRALSFPGCSPAYVSRIERGERVPSLQVIREIARRASVSEQILAFGREALDPAVAGRISAVEAAEAGDDPTERIRAYQALARAASKAARGITS